jgi:hypothetical protein
MNPGAQRVRGDCGLGAVVLAPVDEHLPLAQRLGHPRHGQPGKFGLHALRERTRLVAGLLRGAAADRRVELQALAAGGLRQRPQAAGLEQRAERFGHPAAFHDRGGQSRVEVEDEQVRFPAMRRDGLLRAVPPGTGRETPHRHVQLKARQVGGPDQRGQVVEDQVADRAPGCPGPRTVRLDVFGADPARPVRGRVLGEERLAIHTVGIALERHRAAGDVREQHRRNPLVVVEHLGLGESVGRVEHLRQVGQRQRPAVDLDRDLVHYVSRTTSEGSLSSRSPW